MRPSLVAHAMCGVTRQFFACNGGLSSDGGSLDNPLLHAKNCLVTPHIAWATKEGRMRLIGTAAENLKAFLQGHPMNVVN